MMLDAIETAMVEFEWWRDAAGYRLMHIDVVAGAPNVRTDTFVWWAAPAEADSGTRIVRIGGNLRPYHPMVAPTLFTILASWVKQPSQVLAFIEKFGPLTRDGLNPEIGESVTNVLKHADAMRMALLASASVEEGKSGVPSAMMQSIGSMNPDLVFGPASKAGGPESPIIGPIGSMNAELVFEPGSKVPKIKLHPADLLGALWLQLSQALSRGDTAARQCQHCGVWFIAGGTTGRRIDAKFCSVEHRTLFNSLKRSREK
ncbi:MAG TPA: hypothetical protein VE687_10025 [Stellaceae bacterium]|nr:hypothetical protein [Stellaceae bacterium]